jgi:drug/metabolite transporter (DMT)-like permease
MSLSPARTRAYWFGALAGAFGALAVVASRDRNGTEAGVAAACAAVCGALAVGFEERAQAD